MATASAAEPPRPIARGMCGNTSMSIERSSSASSRSSIARMPATPCWCSSTALMRCSTPQRGISNRTPSAASSTRTSTASGIGAAMACRPYTTACSPSRMTLPFAKLRGSEPGCGLACCVQRAHQFLRLPHLDFAGLDQRFDDAVEQLLRHAGRRCHAARMQRHVTLLDAVGGQRAQRREVLREAHRGHDRREFARVGRAEQAVIDAHGRIRFERSADGADFHRHLDFADQVAAFVLVPARQRRIAAAARRVRVRGGFDRAPVVAGRERAPRRRRS